jgi:hypothetical protein
VIAPRPTTIRALTVPRLPHNAMPTNRLPRVPAFFIFLLPHRCSPHSQLSPGPGAGASSAGACPGDSINWAVGPPSCAWFMFPDRMVLRCKHVTHETRAALRAHPHARPPTHPHPHPPTHPPTRAPPPTHHTHPHTPTHPHPPPHPPPPPHPHPPTHPPTHPPPHTHTTRQLKLDCRRSNQPVYFVPRGPPTCPHASYNMHTSLYRAPHVDLHGTTGVHAGRTPACMWHGRSNITTPGIRASACQTGPAAACSGGPAPGRRSGHNECLTPPALLPTGPPSPPPQRRGRCTDPPSRLLPASA